MTQKFSPIVLIERTLGKGIDQRAVNRLMELCPTAVVRVYHTRPIEKKPVKQIVTMRGKKEYLERLRASSLMSKREDQVKEFVFAQFGGTTEVTIAEGPDLPPTAKAIANCRWDEQFSREIGRSLAFNRALERFKEVSVFQEEDARGIGPALGDD
jgi:hypothetical protein